MHPISAEAHATLATALCEQRLFQEGITSYLRALSLEPHAAHIHRNVGAAYGYLGNHREAIAHLHHALAPDPHHVYAHDNLGLFLGFQGLAATDPVEREALLAESNQALQRARELAPGFAQTYATEATLLAMQGHLDAADHLLTHAITLAPELPQLHVSLGMLRLKRGDYKRGWRDYEWRLKVPPVLVPITHRPRWDGSPLKGRTLLVRTEQGFGDTIQFVRYLPMAKAKGGQIVLECQPELITLLSGIDGCDLLTPRRIDGLPPELPYDLSIELLSLPGLFTTGPERIPAGTPYLQAQPEKQNVWRKRLTQDDGTALRVGIVWSGNRRYVKDFMRSCHLMNFMPLSRVKDVRFYSLQKGDDAPLKAVATAGMRLTDLSAELHDFADTAAAIMNLDLVITVDTSVAHLAGALGRTVWTLLALDSDWRWQLDRADTPWYSTMRLFRQQQMGDWATVMEQVCAELEIYHAIAR